MSEGYAWKQSGPVSMEYGWSGSDTGLQVIKSESKIVTNGKSNYSEDIEF